jgi:hypothetical protein
MFGVEKKPLFKTFSSELKIKPLLRFWQTQGCTQDFTKKMQAVQNKIKDIIFSA